jgi:hypothetical protein
LLDTVQNIVCKSGLLRIPTHSGCFGRFSTYTSVFWIVGSLGERTSPDTALIHPWRYSTSDFFVPTPKLKLAFMQRVGRVIVRVGSRRRVLIRALLTNAKPKNRNHFVLASTTMSNIALAFPAISFAPMFALDRCHGRPGLPPRPSATSSRKSRELDSDAAEQLTKMGTDGPCPRPGKIPYSSFLNHLVVPPSPSRPPSSLHIGRRSSPRSLPAAGVTSAGVQRSCPPVSSGPSFPHLDTDCRCSAER